MKHMSEVGIRALKQNASTVVAEAAGGETVIITDRGRPPPRLFAYPAPGGGAGGQHVTGPGTVMNRLQARDPSEGEPENGGA